MGRLGVPIPALYAGIRPPPPSTATFGCSELRPDASVAVAGSGNVRKRAMSEMFHFAVPALQLLDAPAAAAPPACCAACASACAGCASSAAMVTDAQAQAMALSPSPDAGAAAAALQSANVAGNTSVPSLPPIVPRPPPAFVALPTRQQPAVAAAGEPAAAALSGRTAGCCGYAQKGHKTKGAPCINLSNEKPGWVGSAEHKKYLKRKETEKKDAKK